MVYLKVLTLTDNADADKYIYSGYGIGFNLHWKFSLPGGWKCSYF